MSLGQLIHERRKELGLTLDEVATYAGFSKPYLSTIENGKVNNPPSDGLIEGLEKILKFKKGELARMAHMEKLPTDLRRDIEAIDAENRKYRKLISDIVKHRISVTKARKMLSADDLMPEAKMPKSKSESMQAGLWLPVINRVAAGYPADYDDMGYPVGFADDYVRAPDLHDPNAFAVRVVGDSMEPKYKEGDIVIFSPAAAVESGDDCFVRFTEPHEATFKRIYFDKDGRKRMVRLQPLNDKYPPQTVDPKRINGMYRAVIQHQRL